MDSIIVILMLDGLIVVHMKSKYSTSTPKQTFPSLGRKIDLKVVQMQQFINCYMIQYSDPGSFAPIRTAHRVM